MTPYELWQKDPQAALEDAIQRHSKLSWNPDSIFCWASYSGKDGVRYGSFKILTRKDLEGRKYDIEFWDGAVSLFFTDVWFIPGGSRGSYEPR